MRSLGKSNEHKVVTLGVRCRGVLDMVGTTLVLVSRFLDFIVDTLLVSDVWLDVVACGGAE